MKHAEINQGTLRAYLDGQLNPERVAAIEEHLESCAACREELAILRGHAARVQDSLDRLPELAETANTARAWATFQ
jgi:anti-sigma factor RsiW